MVYDSFISKTQSNGSINPQEFWKFREFYSPGYFRLRDQGLQNSDINSALDEIELNPKNIIYTSLFRAKHTVSLDGLTEAKSLEEIFDINSFQNVIFQNKNTIIFTNNYGDKFMIFLLPISEMKKANGFFEYDGKDKNLLENKSWFNITKING